MTFTRSPILKYPPEGVRADAIEARQQMPRPKAVLFDLDDTLLDAYGDPHGAWTRLLAQHDHGLEPQIAARIPQTIQEVARPYWADAQWASRWRVDLRGARRLVLRETFERLELLDRTAAEGAMHRLADALADAFFELRKSEYKLFPDALPVLSALRVEGVKLALITNGGADIQRHKVSRFELEQYFDHVQIEGEFGKGKPEREVYLNALSKLGCEACDTWMVGDNLEWDVLAPKREGIHGIWFDPHKRGLAGAMHTGVPHTAAREGRLEAQPDRIIHELPELLDLPERGCALRS